MFNHVNVILMKYDVKDVIIMKRVMINRFMIIIMIIF